MAEESKLESKFCRCVKDAGGVAIKVVSPSFSGMPDRLLLMPNEVCAFVEVKSKGKKPRAIQKLRIKQLRCLGFKVYILDDEKQIEMILKEVRSHEIYGT